MGKKRENSHIAPGPMAGYMFQPIRALYWLVKGPRGATVGVETEDDVAVVQKNGRKVLEQDKSSIQKDAWPYGDKSYALWNTLSIWLTAIEEGKIDANETRFFLVTNKAIPDECLVRRLGEAEDEKKAQECYEELRTTGNSIGKASKVGTKARKVLTSDKNVLCRLIRQIAFETFGSSLSEADNEEIISSLHLTEREPHQVIIDALLGWLFNTILDCWNAGEPAWVTREALDNRLELVRAQLRRRRFRASPARDLLVSEEERRRHTGKLFVKQLEIIYLEKEEAYDAIIDFIRCGKERRRLAQEGNVTVQDWDVFHDRLERKWKTVRGIQQAKDYKTVEKCGQAVYYNTMAHEEQRVGDVETEQYLVTGSYHHLADRLVVGWHPEYKNKLKKFCRMG